MTFMIKHNKNVRSMKMKLKKITDHIVVLESSPVLEKSSNWKGKILSCSMGIFTTPIFEPEIHQIRKVN